MDWIKRNLFFLIGGVVALALLGGAGFYLYKNLSQDGVNSEKLGSAREELKRLNAQKPHPGDGKKVDNIKLAKEQQAEVRAFIQKTGNYFVPIPAIPDLPKVRAEDFTSHLRETIAMLQKTAASSSITLPPRYNFSFEAQKPKLNFADESLKPLAVQLGEVKAICDILFRAKINALDNLRRERVDKDDLGETDYHNEKSVTNDLGVLTEYQINFRCFTPELAQAVAGFSGSPHGFIIKGIGIEKGAVEMVQPTPLNPNPVPVPVPTAQPLPTAPAGAIAAETAAARYGGNFGKGGGVPVPAPVAQPVYVVPQPTQPRATTGLPTVLNENPLKVSLTVQLVKLRPQK